MSLVDQLAEDLNKKQSLIKRNTVSYPKKPVSEEDEELLDPETLTLLYRIEGIEYLPEGFLNLDPKLFKDNSEFDSKISERHMDNEQLRIRELQKATQSSSQKMKDLSIYQFDENKNKLMEFLDNWFFKNRKRMTIAELDHMANRLGASPESLLNLQNVFLQTKKLINTNVLRNHLTKKGLTKDQKLNSLPKNIQKFFKDGTSNPQTLFDSSQEGNNKTSLSSQLTFKRAPSAPEGSRDSENRSLTFNVPLDFQIQDYVDKDIDAASENLNSLKANGKDNQNNKNSIQQGKSLNEPELAERSSTMKKEKKLSEVHKIRIDSLIRDYEKNPFDFRSRGEASLSPEADRKSNSSLQRPSDYEYGRMAQISPSFLKKIGFDQDNDISLERNSSQGYPYKKSSQKDSTAIRGLNDSQVRHSSRNQESASGELKRSRVDEEGKLINNQGSEYTEVNIVSFLDEPTRVTVVGRSDGSQSIVSQKLKPILVGGKYYFQTVNDLLKEDGTRKVFVFTMNEQGSIVNESVINQEMVGNYYVNGLVDSKGRQLTEIQAEKENSVSILVINEQGKIVAKIPVPAVLPKEARPTLDAQKRRFLKTITPETIRSELRPVLVGNQYFRQIIVETKKEKEPKVVMIETRDEQGNLLSVEDLNPEDLGAIHSTEVVEERVDPNGKRAFRLATINEDGETIMLIEVCPSIPEFGDLHFDYLLEEVIDQEGNRKLTVLSQGADNRPVVLKQVVRPSVVAQPLTTFVIEDGSEEKSKNIPEQDTKEFQNKKDPSNIFFIDALVDEGELKRLTMAHQKSSLLSVSPHQTNQNSFNSNEHVKQKDGRSSVISRVSALKFANYRSEEGHSSQQKQDLYASKELKSNSSNLNNSISFQQDNINKTEISKKHSGTSVNPLPKNYTRNTSSSSKHSGISNNKPTYRISEVDISHDSEPRNMQSSSESFNQKQSLTWGKSGVTKIKTSVVDIEPKTRQSDYERGKTSMNELQATSSSNLSQSHRDQFERKKKLLLPIEIDNHEQSNTTHLSSNQADRLRTIALEVFSEEISKMNFPGFDTQGGSSLLDEFYEFCEQRLPYDERYKESVLLVSLFYYFIEKKGKLPF